MRSMFIWKSFGLDRVPIHLENSYNFVKFENCLEFYDAIFGLIVNEPVSRRISRRPKKYG